MPGVARLTTENAVATEAELIEAMKELARVPQKIVWDGERALLYEYDGHEWKLCVFEPIDWWDK